MIPLPTVEAMRDLTAKAKAKAKVGGAHEEAMDKVINRICHAASRGARSTNHYGNLMVSVETVLKDAGYKVERLSEDRTTWVNIAW